MNLVDLKGSDCLEEKSVKKLSLQDIHALGVGTRRSKICKTPWLLKEKEMTVCPRALEVPATNAQFKRINLANPSLDLTRPPPQPGARPRAKLNSLFNSLSSRALGLEEWENNAFSRRGVFLGGEGGLEEGINAMNGAPTPPHNPQLHPLSTVLEAYRSVLPLQCSVALSVTAS